MTPSKEKEDKTVKDFKLTLKVKDVSFNLEIPVTLPFDVLMIREFAQRIMNSFELPIFLEDEIEEKLRIFVEQENLNFHEQTIEKNVKAGNREKNIRDWERAFREETLKYNPPEVVGDDEVFAEAYHALVHSPLLGTLLRKESALNSSIRELQRLKNEEIFSLNDRQNTEMSNAISNLNGQNNPSDINKLAAFHFEKSHMVRTKWQSIIESENAKQKREYRNWIVKTYQDYYTSEEMQSGHKEKGGKKKLSVRFDETLMISYGEYEVQEEAEDTSLQESFTIHLESNLRFAYIGSQMKQTYNIRLFCSHPIDFLRFRNERSIGGPINPQRLQTAISIYSSDLSGLIVLADPNFSPNYGIIKEISELSAQTTEFHFDRLEYQLEDRPQQLKPGDFLISKHSNLNGTQVIFYLIANEHSLSNAELNSRDPIILGLRNILKTACLNDVTTITIPALLTNDMTEDMNSQWLNRRAELVYKCVKGFMIEMGSWGGAEMKNLQFIAPKNLTEDIFHSLSAMLPNIFRVSTPLRLSSSSSGQSLHTQLSFSSNN